MNESRVMLSIAAVKTHESMSGVTLGGGPRSVPIARAARRRSRHEAQPPVLLVLSQSPQKQAPSPNTAHHSRRAFCHRLLDLCGAADASAGPLLCSRVESTASPAREPTAASGRRPSTGWSPAEKHPQGDGCHARFERVLAHSRVIARASEVRPSHPSCGGAHQSALQSRLATRHAM